MCGGGSKLDLPSFDDEIESAEGQMDYASDERDVRGKQTEEKMEKYDEMLGELQDGSRDLSSFARETGEVNKDDFNDMYRGFRGDYAQSTQDFASQASLDDHRNKAFADTYQAMEQQRQSSAASLQSYGIDPSQMRSGALDQTARTNMAAQAVANATRAGDQREMAAMQAQQQALTMGNSLQQSSMSAMQQAGAQDMNTANLGNAGMQAQEQYLGTGVSWNDQYNQSLNQKASFKQMESQARQAEDAANAGSGGDMMGGAMALGAAALTGGASLWATGGAMAAGAALGSQS